MMLTKLQDVILPEVLINISFSAEAPSEGELILKESAPDSRIKKLHITGIPEQSLAFTLDHGTHKDSKCFKQLSCYLNPASEKINKSCDLVIVMAAKNTWKVLILDLKSDKPRLKETEAQLLNSELYVQYLLSLLKYHYDQDISHVIFQRTIVTTRIQKDSVYKPNEGRFNQSAFRSVPVSVKNNESYVHVGKLFDQKSN